MAAPPTRDWYVAAPSTQAARASGRPPSARSNASRVAFWLMVTRHVALRRCLRRRGSTLPIPAGSAERRGYADWKCPCKWKWVNVVCDADEACSENAGRHRNARHAFPYCVRIMSGTEPSASARTARKRSRRIPTRSAELPLRVVGMNVTLSSPCCMLTIQPKMLAPARSRA